MTTAPASVCNRRPGGLASNRLARLEPKIEMSDPGATPGSGVVPAAFTTLYLPTKGTRSNLARTTRDAFILTTPLLEVPLRSPSHRRKRKPDFASTVTRTEVSAQ